MKSRFFAAALLLLAAVSFSPIAEAQTAPIPTTFRVFGQVKKSTTFDLTALKKLPVTSENVTYFAAGSVQSHNFTGALLWDLLQSTGIVVDPTIKNDILRLVIIVTGSDGYTSVFGAGEVTPGFGGDQIVIAYAQDGLPLGSDGFAKIVAPGDKMGGRFVSNIVKIEVRNLVPASDAR